MEELRPPLPSGCGFKLGVTLFLPRIANVVVAAHFPETKAVFGKESYSFDEFGAFPCVKFGNDDPGGAAMLEGDRFAGELGCDEHIVIQAIFERDVGRVPVVTGKIDKLGLRLGLHDLKKSREGHAGPLAVVFAPRSDAVKIAQVGDLGQGVELLPGKRGRFFHKSVNSERPFSERYIGTHAEIEHRKSGRQFLARGKSVGRSDIARLETLSQLFLRPLLFCRDIAFLRHEGTDRSVEKFRKPHRSAQFLGELPAKHANDAKPD
jgi:hypothetical protein